jgi:hypothetical protein
MKPGSERAPRFELEHALRGIDGRVRLPRRANRDPRGETEGDEMLFPLVAPRIADELRHPWRPGAVDLLGRAFGEGFRFEARDERRFTGGSALGERRLVALFDPLGAELEKEGGSFVRFFCCDIDVKLRVTRLFLHGENLGDRGSPGHLAQGAGGM